MKRKGHSSEIIPYLGFIFVSMLAVMFLYELAKQLIHPEISMWESHTVTIFFTSAMAVIIVFFPLRSLYREKQKSASELRLRIGAEERLRQSEMQYRTFVESVEDSIYIVDPECRYLLINARHLARRGLSPVRYAGKPYADLHSDEETQRFTDLVQRVLDTKTLFRDEYEKDGKYYLRKLHPVIDPDNNEVVAITVISSDITEQKRSEQSLETTNKKLNLMTDVTRHDLKNQLLLLQSFLVLAGEEAGSGNIRHYLQKCEQVIKTIHAQINFTRDYQKIGVERPRWQNVTATIRKARSILDIPVLTIDIPPDIEIYADPLLEKVFYNILENAVRHAGPKPEVRFSLITGTGDLRIICQDNGPGIPDGEKEMIFERGFGKNTGLGLFLIREILSITGISIHENGMPGRGSRFELMVPAGVYRQGSSH